MTQITGKIYQMKNAEGTENRFPRTVIEGVLGLSSYLQNQFSSLADIYMPIGGIYQSQTGQEFVYRATPNTIKAKSFTLDRIQGKSLAWNQAVPLGGSYWTLASSTAASFSYNDGVITISSLQGAVAAKLARLNNFTPVIGHKYYLSVNIDATHLGSNYTASIALTKSTNANEVSAGLDGGGKGRISQVGTTEEAVAFSCRLSNATPENEYAEFSNILLVDLTLLYGSEISGMTDAQILAKFESEYPGYHDYSAGTLISNDASKIETVGRNVWDEEWESGYYDVGGAKLASAHLIRSINYIKIIPHQNYYIKTPSTLYICEYDGRKNFIRRALSLNSSGSIMFGAGTEYIRFCVGTAGDPVPTYNHDICINISDESFNGQYEPYRKVVLPLNLDDFWVKDGQGNQVHITGGLKSAGSVHDEIVGNKYIKRVGSVDLGTLNWLSDTTLGFTRFKSNHLPDGYEAEVTGYYARCVSDRYAIADTLQGIDQKDKTIKIFPGAQACIRDSVYDSYTAAQLKAALTGSTFYYQLATPIEYELVEPLIYTMKAGTTEARISPNQDGLSAPFCCDMTYSASDNNDADNAQYAATAGRLLNTHTILGQQFNGTQDIGGAISDVSSIDGAIIFNLTNPNDPKVGISTLAENITERLTVNGNVKATQLISTATGTLASGTPPLTVASKTMVSNLNANYVGGKTLAEILASDITGNAATATKLQTGRNITISDGTHSGTSVSFDGSSAITLPLPTNLNVGTLDASGAITLSGAGSTNKRIYFSSNVYLELTSTGLHLNGAGLYSDSFITAYGTNESEALEALKAWVTENFEPKQS